MQTLKATNEEPDMFDRKPTDKPERAPRRQTEDAEYARENSTLSGLLVVVAALVAVLLAVSCA